MLASLYQTPRPGTAPQEGNLSSFSDKTHACPQDQVCTGLSTSLHEVLFWRCNSNGTRSCFGNVSAMACVDMVCITLGKLLPYCILVLCPGCPLSKYKSKGMLVGITSEL